MASITGTEDNDTIQPGENIGDIPSTEAADVIFGLAGNDVIDGAGGDDIIDGGPGYDLVDGGDGDDTIDGGSGDDALYGGLGSNTISGGDGLDYIDFWVGAGALGGHNVGYGGAGNDRFYIGPDDEGFGE